MFPVQRLSKQLLKTSTRYLKMTTKPSPENAKLLKQYEPAHLDDCKWVGLQKLDYLDPTGTKREWEMTVRKTRSTGTNSDSDSIDGVGVIALLKHPNEPTRILLQKQFRPPVDGVCIEIPAGLIDPSESVETSAIRELKEETGYSGKIIEKSPVFFNDPGFTNTNMCLVTMEIDVTLPENQNPEPELEENEFIETFSVEIDKFDDKLLELYEQGYILDARVQNVAYGFRMAKMFKDVL